MREVRVGHKTYYVKKPTKIMQKFEDIVTILTTDSEFYEKILEDFSDSFDPTCTDWDIDSELGQKLEGVSIVVSGVTYYIDLYSGKKA